MKVSNGVHEEPLSIQACWTAREYATRKPTATTFQVWTLSFEVTSESDVLVTRVLLSPRFLRFGKTYRSGADRIHTVELSLRWHDYGSTDLLTISFTGGNDVSIEDRELGLNPQQWVNVVAPESAATGTVIPLAKVPRLDDLEVQIICLAKADTVNTHGRWAIKPTLRTELLDRYDFLASGTAAGVKKLPGDPPRGTAP